jgi:hypothetical protein
LIASGRLQLHHTALAIYMYVKWLNHDIVEQRVEPKKLAEELVFAFVEELGRTATRLEERQGT